MSIILLPYWLSMIFNQLLQLFHQRHTRSNMSSRYFINIKLKIMFIINNDSVRRVNSPAGYSYIGIPLSTSLHSSNITPWEHSMFLQHSTFTGSNVFQVRALASWRCVRNRLYIWRPTHIDKVMKITLFT